MIEGGTIEEAHSNGKSPQRLWTAIKLQDSSSGGTPAGIFFNKFSNIIIRNANIGINFVIDGSNGYIYTNRFEFLRLLENNTFIDFDISQSILYRHTYSTPGIHRNYFESLECISSPKTEFAVKNIRHVGNTFANVNISSLPSQHVISVIHYDASNTVIIGGTLTECDFRDYGFNTKIIVATNASPISKRTAIHASSTNIIGEGLLADLQRNGNISLCYDPDFGQFINIQTTDIISSGAAFVCLKPESLFLCHNFVYLQA